MSPTIHADNLSLRIERCRKAFARGETVDGKSFSTKAQREVEKALALTPETRGEYLKGAHFGVARGSIEVSEFGRIQSALTGVLDPESGWHVGLGLADKVIITKVCNELLEQRGDA